MLKIRVIGLASIAVGLKTATEFALNCNLPGGNHAFRRGHLRRDLPLYDDAAQVGLGIWNYPVFAFSLEALLLFGGMIMYLRRTRPLSRVGRLGPPIFGILMLAIQAYVFFGPALTSPAAAAVTALVSYVVFATIAHWLDRSREPAAS